MTNNTWPPKCPECGGKLIHSMEWTEAMSVHVTRCQGVYLGRPCTYERKVFFSRINL